MISVFSDEVEQRVYKEAQMFGKTFLVMFDRRIGPYIGVYEAFELIFFFCSVGSIQTASYVEIRIPAVRNQTCSERSAYSTTTAHERADFNSRR